MTVASLLAVLWLVLPKTPVPADLKGWETSGVWTASYAASSQHLLADLSAQGHHLVRRETLGTGAKPHDLYKFANGRGDVVIVLLWRIGPTVTGYSFRRETVEKKP